MGSDPYREDRLLGLPLPLPLPLSLLLILLGRGRGNVVVVGLRARVRVGRRRALVPVVFTESCLIGDRGRC